MWTHKPWKGLLRKDTWLLGRPKNVSPIQILSLGINDEWCCGRKRQASFQRLQACGCKSTPPYPTFRQNKMLQTRGNKSNSRADVAGHGPDLCGQPLNSPWESERMAFLKHDLQQTGGGQCRAGKMSWTLWSYKNTIYRNLRLNYRGMVVTCGMMPLGKGAETTPSSSRGKEQQRGLWFWQANSGTIYRVSELRTKQNVIH